MKESFRGEACQEAAVPCGGFTLETHGAFRGGAFRIALLAVCFIVANLAGARSLRARHPASRKTISITQCKLFSTAR